MSRTVRNSLIVAALILAYPACAWLLGLRVQHQWQDREQRGLQQFPGYAQYVTIVKRDYRRGVYSATEEVTFRLGEKFLKAMHLPGNPFQLTVRNTIHHGPLPQLRDFAPATVDTDWVLPPEVHDKLVAAFHGKANLTMHTHLNWLGGSTSVMHSSPFNVPLENGAVLDWRGLDVRAQSGSEVGSGTVNLSAPGITVKTDKGDTLGLQDIKLDSNLKSAYEVLNIGDLKLTVGQIQVEDANKPSSC